MSLTMDMPISEAIEAEARTVMAMRAGLKEIPGTHAKQAELLAEVDVLLDQWLEAGAEG